VIEVIYLEIGRVEGLILAFMGWVTVLAGLLIMVQERVLRLDIGGYRVENPYWELGVTLVAGGIGLMFFGLLVRAYNVLKQKQRQKVS
jgi:hypothetical protein